MKNILLLFLFVGSGIFAGVKAQGNLQFNQVLLHDATAAGNLVSVPAGKVWKIENVVMNSNNAYVQITIGGTGYFLLNTSSGYKNLPFWLPSGANVTFYSSGAGQFGKVSIIEFNVVP